MIEINKNIRDSAFFFAIFSLLTEPPSMPITMISTSIHISIYTLINTLVIMPCHKHGRESLSTARQTCQNRETTYHCSSLCPYSIHYAVTTTKCCYCYLLHIFSTRHGTQNCARVAPLPIFVRYALYSMILFSN